MPENNIYNKNHSLSTQHGVLIDIRGIGVLIIGPSGIGKSDCALELISTKQCRLISDDIVELRVSHSGHLIGNAPERIKHLMEIRGVGIVNIKDLYGTDSVLDQKQIGMVIELCAWDFDTDYDRLGIDEKIYNILGVDLPYLLIPITTTRNIATIAELAVLNQLLKSSDSKNKEQIKGELNIVKSVLGVK